MYPSSRVSEVSLTDRAFKISWTLKREFLLVSTNNDQLGHDATAKSTAKKQKKITLKQNSLLVVFIALL